MKKGLRNKGLRTSHFLVAFLLLCLFPLSSHGYGTGPSLTGLAKEVSGLKLGFGPYAIGKTLTAEQRTMAQKHLLADSYQGTYKFQDGDINVVVTADSHLVLAIYKHLAEVDRAGVKAGVAQLMDEFGEPTTMAHDRLIYWAYGKKGKISEEDLQNAKKTGELSVLATVKFSSTTDIMNDNDKQEAPAESSTIYTLISSPLLLERFAKQ